MHVALPPGHNHTSLFRLPAISFIRSSVQNEIEIIVSLHHKSANYLSKYFHHILGNLLSSFSPSLPVLSLPSLSTLLSLLKCVSWHSRTELSDASISIQYLGITQCPLVTRDFSWELCMYFSLIIF